MKSLSNACLGFLFAAVSIFGADADNWSEIRIADQPTGYQHIARQTAADGSVQTTDESIIVINRMGSRVEVRTRTETLETPEGRVVSVREESSSSKQAVVTEARFEEEAITVASTSGDNTYTRSIPNTEPVHGPAHFARLSVDGLREPGQVVASRMFLPSLGVHTMRRTLLRIEEREGQALYHVTSSIDGYPGDAEEVLRADGTTLSVRRELPFGTMVASAATREIALRAAAGGELPGEAYARTLARANIRLPDPRTLESVRLRITHRRPEYGWPPMRGAWQHVIEKTADRIDLDVHAARGNKPPAQQPPRDTDLGSNQILQADDAKIIALSREIVAGEDDPEKKVLRLQSWVARHMEFDTGVAVTPASEVVRDRRGTCVAYSVLLASLARATGLPARVAMGYVYVAGMWGGHAWVEVWLGGVWHAIDAAAYRPGYADAARFQIDSYDFEDGGVSGNYHGLQVYGNIDVTVIEYKSQGRRHLVEAGAQPHVVAGDVYTNPWLGISVRKPSSMQFADLDAIYPDPTVLRARGDSASFHVALLPVGADPERSVQDQIQTIDASGPGVACALAGVPATSIVGAGKARVLCQQGQSLWMITAEGSGEVELLNAVMETWKWTNTEP